MVDRGKRDHRVFWHGGARRRFRRRPACCGDGAWRSGTSTATPDAMLLMSPVLDLTCQLAMDRDLRRRDPFASAISASRTMGLYVAGADPADPRISVLDADLTDMPPTLIQVGGREMLLDDSRVFAKRLQTAGGLLAVASFPRPDPCLPGDVSPIARSA